jgi:hypothetical protein
MSGRSFLRELPGRGIFGEGFRQEIQSELGFEGWIGF